MGFKLGVVIGFAAGYVLGTKAGQQRFDQIRRTADKAWHSPPAEKIKATASDAAGDIGHKAIDAVKNIKDRAQESDEPVVSARLDGNGALK